MSFLYEQLDDARNNWGNYTEIPSYIQENINPSFTLRPYQVGAFENFITYFENDKMCRKPTQTLFHMATGSGKTMIMAGLMLYLYKKGYRDFLFFVNLSSIIVKTKDNFTDSTSSKYLFADEIEIDGERIQIKVVNNFQNTDKDSINICFTTIQGLHADMNAPKENVISIEDFSEKKIVLISDEAHHLNVDTKTLSKDKYERDNHQSWESTVHRILNSNKENVLLEFTATCDTKNPQILAEYENKIVFDYPLSKFREDGYSKEIKTLQSDFDVEERALQALILSQYRYKVFQAHKQNIKPVVFFKSKLVKENKTNMQKIIDMVQSLGGKRIKSLLEETSSEIMQEANRYFIDNSISYDDLAAELREDFSEVHCISANDDREVEEKQKILNSLEDKNNPYRAIFAVDKLNEGWDVLNLFDIVRLYETRDGKNGKPGKTTIKEAQLIGRGARYCPFAIDHEQSKDTRKYDSDVDNPLRVCEELYYHCWNEPRYISELRIALKDIGLDPEKTVEVNYVLKDDFKADELYKTGLVFLNERIVRGRSDVIGLLPSVRDKLYRESFSTGSSAEDVLFEAGALNERAVKSHVTHKTLGEIASINYAIVHKAVCKYNVLKFNRLKTYFPNLKSMREFIFDDHYLGNIHIDIESKYKDPPASVLHEACIRVLGKIADSVSSIEETYEGSKEFSAAYIHDVFKDKKCNYTQVHEGGKGYSQNDITVDKSWRIDLSKEDWFAFDDNFGTREEKEFVAYFKSYVPRLKEKYDKVFLLRNERQLHIYSFEGGERFEPDYLIFLHSNKVDGYEQVQIFVEPKGSHLIATDKWKEDFMLEIEGKAIPKTLYVDDNDYRIWGFHFFNQAERLNEFNEDFGRIVDDIENPYEYMQAADGSGNEYKGNA